MLKALGCGDLGNPWLALHRPRSARSLLKNKIIKCQRFLIVQVHGIMLILLKILLPSAANFTQWTFSLSSGLAPTKACV
jgi:hypothetical protein